MKYESCLDAVKQSMEELNRKAREDYVTLFDVYAELGVVEDTELERKLHPELLSHGWTRDKGFHELTLKERHPEGCPCCGRPWPV